MALITKLNPPILDATLPAQVGSYLNIPFLMNRAVGINQINKIALILKTVQSNVVLIKEQGYLVSSQLIQANDGNYHAYFELNNEISLEIGQYYKAQIAYIDKEDNIGYYSTIGVFKYTAKPNLIISNLKEGQVNFTSYIYTGKYSQDKEKGDITERVYSYCFEIYDRSNNLIISSGELLHNSDNDTEVNEQVDVWETKVSLPQDIVYQIYYKVKTNNNLEVSSASYLITNTDTVDLNINSNLVVENNQDEGYNSIMLQGKGEEKYINGQFILLRSSDEDDFKSWTQYTKFLLNNWNAQKSEEICKDFAISQGITYKYAIQAYNSYGIYSNKLESNSVKVEFEDMYLYDGEHQLKIRFNPKVSSFKTTLLESKSDTLGGKYPFFFRNGNVSYKEFQISGLISLLMDENNLFNATLSELTEPVGIETQLITDTIHRERDFKLQVLNWLNNSKPKLFRSPTEGNYIVRLMNVSMSPIDSLGRMLHTFTANAYEIADYDFSNLQKYGIVAPDQTKDATYKLTFEQKALTGSDSLELPQAYVCSVQGGPFTDFYYTLFMRGRAKGTISATGTFIFPEEILNEHPIISIESDNWNATSSNGCTVTYGYYVPNTFEDFNIIKSIDITEDLTQQVGNSADFIQEHQDVRTKIGAIYYLKLMRRPIILCNVINGEVHDRDNSSLLIVNPLYLYLSSDGSYYDGRDLTTTIEPDFTFGLNGNKIDMKGANDPGTFGRYEALTDLVNTDSLYIGNGIYIDAIAYQIKTYTYTIEETNQTVESLKAAWKANPEDKEMYQAYIEALSEALEAAQKELSVNAV